MSAQVTMERLLAYLQQFRENISSAEKPVFWLGAGCSVYDGIPVNSDLLACALPKHVSWGSPQYQFDEFCGVLGTPAARAKYLRPFFERTIKEDSPYHGLVWIVRNFFADLIFTFNIDDLLEQALARDGLKEEHDFVVIKAPQTRPQFVAAHVRATQGPRIRVVKLHGDYRFGFNYMTSQEIVDYEKEIKELVEEYSARPAVVCGYSFFHLNVLKAFSETGGPFFYVNKHFPDAPMVLSLMAKRSKHANFIDGSLGSFESFVSTLVGRLR